MKIIIHLNNNFHSLWGSLYAKIIASIAYENHYTFE